MFIDEIYIKNYRCFGDTPTVIEFSKSGLTALIGPNNVGKSTVLKILDILLGDKWPSGRFSEEDFHDNNIEKEIVLACTFADKIEIDLKGVKIPIYGVAVRARHLPTGHGESSTDVEYRLLESDTNIASMDFDQLDIATYRYKDGKRGDSPIYLSQEIKNQLPIVITIPLIKLEAEQPTKKWSVLGRMLQKVENDFAMDSSGKASFEEKIREAVRVLRIKEFDEIEKDIQTFWNRMKPANLTGTELKFLDYEPWRYYRQFKLSIKQNKKDVPLETLGEGVQRLSIIALYRTYLKKHGRNERAILLIEEPESYLHPQARKTLFRILKQAIKEKEEVEGQIIYTTHSEDFIDCGSFDDIVIFARHDNEVLVRHLDENILKRHTIALGQSGSEISDQHIHYRLVETITQGLKEALFTHKAVIAEGPSEVELFRFFSDTDKEQIGVVSAGGKSNIPAIYSFLTGFGVPCLIVVDRDADNEKENSKMVSILSQVNAKDIDNTKMKISLEEIETVQDGEIFFKDRILIFGKNLDTVLNKKIPRWTEIINELRNTYSLPSKQKLSPRDIQAFGLAFIREFGGNVQLEKLMKESEPNIIEFCKQLNAFINQNVTPPKLLEPKNEQK